MTSTEIQLYKSSVANHANINLDDENFSILQYWHQVKGVFPILSSMALDIFAVPVSTIVSKSYFSAANRVLIDKRTRLGPDVFEALALLND
jgi:hAT family C-terminal dimerisation region